MQAARHTWSPLQHDGWFPPPYLWTPLLLGSWRCFDRFYASFLKRIHFLVFLPEHRVSNVSLPKQNLQETSRIYIDLLTPKILENTPNTRLVGGWTNPSENDFRPIGSFPHFFGIKNHKTYLKKNTTTIRRNMLQGWSPLVIRLGFSIQKLGIRIHLGATEIRVFQCGFSRATRIHWTPGFRLMMLVDADPTEVPGPYLLFNRKTMGLAS